MSAKGTRLFFYLCNAKIQTITCPTPNTNPQAEHFTAPLSSFPLHDEVRPDLCEDGIKKERAKCLPTVLLFHCCLRSANKPTSSPIKRGLYFKQALLRMPFIWDPLKLVAGISARTLPPRKNSPWAYFPSLSALSILEFHLHLIPIRLNNRSPNAP